MTDKFETVKYILCLILSFSKKTLQSNPTFGTSSQTASKFSLLRTENFVFLYITKIPMINKIYLTFKETTMPHPFVRVNYFIIANMSFNI